MIRHLPSAIRHPPTALRLGLALALMAVALGAALGFAGPVITVAGLAAGAAALWALTRLEIGLWGVVAIITLLPFGGLPFKIVFTPTFLDLALVGVFAVYLFQWMGGRRRRLTLTPAHAPIALFWVLAVFSFVAGMSNGPLTANLIRQFGELLLGIALTFIIVDHVDSRETLSRLVRVILICGAAAAALGLALYFLPETLSERLLSSLRVFNYPSGGVLRYIEDDPAQAQRAISTSVDPNVLGGLLAMVGGLLAPQLLIRKPVLGSRWMAYPAFGVVTACLVLTFSRGAMAALAVALVGIALARYRRMLWIVLAVALVILFLPAMQGYVTRFVEGVQGQDLATQMRFGEYKDAFILIGRYPWLGVGFAGAPEIDIYLGVSNAYLLMISEMGLVGLAAFLLAVGTVMGWGYVNRRKAYADPSLTALWLGAHAGLAAALAVGVVDHYFFNLTFPHASAFFWMMTGLCLSATRLAASARTSAPKPATEG
jgi:O-antigen ligase